MDSKKILNMLMEDDEWSTIGNSFWLKSTAAFDVQLLYLNGWRIDANPSPVWPTDRKYYYQLETGGGWIEKTAICDYSGDATVNANYITVPANTKIHFRCATPLNAELGTSINGGSNLVNLVLTFKVKSADSRISAGGELGSLGSGDYVNRGLFYNCTQLTDISQIQYTAGYSSHQFEYMFYGCTNLVNIKLPARVQMAYQCQYMFKNCTSITDANPGPTNMQVMRAMDYTCYGMFANCYALTGSTYKIQHAAMFTGSYGYAYMFESCSNLKTSPLQMYGVLRSGGDGSQTYMFAGMFKNCTSLTAVPDIFGSQRIVSSPGPGWYKEMFFGCTSLSTFDQPFLYDYTVNNNPTILCTNVCYQMFQGCTKLTYIPTSFFGPVSAVQQTCCKDMFARCFKLTSAPALAASALAPSCYQEMFWQCTSLITPPGFSGTVMASSCCQDMFFQCKSLTAVPEIHIDTTAPACCAGMFEQCSSLTHLPRFTPLRNATTLKKNCFQSMFAMCTNLSSIEAPILGYANTHSGAVLQESCCASMFNNCTKLTHTPNLPFVNLASSCYNYMFAICPSLIAASPLPATTLAPSCYQSMFAGCTNLTSLSAAFRAWPSNNATTNWVKDINTTGVYYGPSSLPVTKGVNNIPTNWSKSPQHFGGQVYPDTELRNYYDQVSQRNIIALQKSGNTTIRDLYGKWQVNSSLVRVEGPITVSANTATSFTFIFDTTSIVLSSYPGSGSTSTDSLTATPHLPINNPGNDWMNPWPYQDLDILIRSVKEAGTYDQLRFASTYTWRKNNTGSWNSSTTPIPLSIDSVQIQIALQGHLAYNNTWANWNSFIFDTYMSKEVDRPVTMWSTQGEWNLNVKNPRNLEFYYQILNGTTVQYEHVTKANPISIKVPQNQFLKIWNRGCGLNLSTTNLVQFNSTPTTTKVNMSGFFTSLSGLNPFSGTTFRGYPQPYTYYGLCSGWTALQMAYKDMLVAPSCVYTQTQLSTHWSTTSAYFLREWCPDYYCAYMFANCPNLLSGASWNPNLGKTLIGIGAFKGIYKGCTSLTVTSGCLSTGTTNASGKVRDSAFEQAFSGCTSLVNTNIKIGKYGNTNNGSYTRKNAYDSMYAECTKLTNANNTISLYVGNPDYQQYRRMFAGCSAMTIAPTISEYPQSNQNVNQRAYFGMFSGCASLTDINVAAFCSQGTAASESYGYMFAGCSSLTFGVTSTQLQNYSVIMGSLYDLNHIVPAMNTITVNANAYTCMFKGCTSLLIAPILSSTNTTSNSYEYMFQDCSNLRVIADTGLYNGQGPYGSQYSYILYGNRYYGSDAVFHVKCTGCDDSVAGIRNYIPDNWSIHFIQP